MGIESTSGPQAPGLEPAPCELAADSPDRVAIETSTASWTSSMPAAENGCTGEGSTTYWSKEGVIANSS
ncbi:hypothetical protein AKJ09_00096 [Labilithrix luteola]|uniref:Uncharacterized protein n=1 Tax=Labilithrix luteola TaxID=1391654 RepID=A0A0K1PIT8_9BACT|nr:hypothetical protein AKJ09_00096 [Labilithrix luteola]